MKCLLGLELLYNLFLVTVVSARDFTCIDLLSSVVFSSFLTQFQGPIASQ
jgi:hypothetical protein